MFSLEYLFCLVSVVDKWGMSMRLMFYLICDFYFILKVFGYDFLFLVRESFME